MYAENDPVQQNIKEWLEGDYDEKSKEEIRKKLKENPDELVDAFYKRLEFGTGGLRGIMGVGINRINIYTIRAASQGLANYINQKNTSKNFPCIFIGYDTRNDSRKFAEEAAEVFSGNNIEVYIFKRPSGTPLVSFGCRYKGCMGAVMITASHNPSRYNGYKVYGEDGAQVLDPDDKNIIQEVNKINTHSVHRADLEENPLIHFVQSEIEIPYYEALQKRQLFPEINQSEGHTLHIVYTSLHGTGITLIPEALAICGFSRISLVEDQCIPDGNFPTVTYPNPEDPKTLKSGIELMLSEKADLLLATDPDADRMAVVVNHKGKAKILTGNQIACLCVEYICTALRSRDALSRHSAFVKTVVTGDLFKVIAEKNGATCFEVLTGFKYIAELIRKGEKTSDDYEFIFGAEESFGFLFGVDVRDKDAGSASVLICEIALKARLEGKTLWDRLFELYEKYGVYTERLYMIEFEESKEGHEKMREKMTGLRKSPVMVIGGSKVVHVQDFLSSIEFNVETGKSVSIELPKTDLLGFILENGNKVMIRPSGTEPKIKIYGFVRKKRGGEASISDTMAICEHVCDSLINEIVSNLK